MLRGSGRSIRIDELLVYFLCPVIRRSVTDRRSDRFESMLKNGRHYLLLEIVGKIGLLSCFQYRLINVGDLHVCGKPRPRS